MSKTNTARKVSALKELVLAHQAYKRAAEEFQKVAFPLSALNSDQEDALIHACDTTDPREVSEDTLALLLQQMEQLK